MIAVNTCSLIRENKYQHRFKEGNNEFVNFCMKISNEYYTFLASLSPHFTLSSLTSTSLSPHHLTISPLWFSLTQPSYPFTQITFPTLTLLSFHTLTSLSPSLFHLALTHFNPSLPHTHSFSLITLPNLTSLSHLTLPSFFLSPHSPHSLSSSHSPLSLSHSFFLLTFSNFPLP